MRVTAMRAGDEARPSSSSGTEPSGRPTRCAPTCSGLSPPACCRAGAYDASTGGSSRTTAALSWAPRSGPSRTVCCSSPMRSGGGPRPRTRGARAAPGAARCHRPAGGRQRGRGRGRLVDRAARCSSTCWCCRSSRRQPACRARPGRSPTPTLDLGADWMRQFGEDSGSLVPDPRESFVGRMANHRFWVVDGEPVSFASHAPLVGSAGARSARVGPVSTRPRAPPTAGYGAAVTSAVVDAPAARRDHRHAVTPTRRTPRATASTSGSASARSPTSSTSTIGA